jgi:hypothetical protein
VDPDRPYLRAMLFLEAIRAVWLGTACLTEDGAAYLGIPFHFRTRPPEVPEPVGEP